MVAKMNIVKILCLMMAIAHQTTAKIVIMDDIDLRQLLEEESSMKSPLQIDMELERELIQTEIGMDTPTKMSHMMDADDEAPVDIAAVMEEAVKKARSQFSSNNKGDLANSKKIKEEAINAVREALKKALTQTKAKSEVSCKEKKAAEAEEKIRTAVYPADTAVGFDYNADGTKQPIWFLNMNETSRWCRTMGSEGFFRNYGYQNYKTLCSDVDYEGTKIKMKRVPLVYNQKPPACAKHVNYDSDYEIYPVLNLVKEGEIPGNLYYDKRYDIDSSTAYYSTRTERIRGVMPSFWLCPDA